MSTTEKDVATALLGSWPSQVASWGKSGIAAYLAEVGARGVTPHQALVALRSCEADQKFPPSAPELAALARVDPDVPIWSEAFDKIYGRGGVLCARPSYPPGGWTGDELQVAQDKLALERADGFHRLLGAFVRTQTLRRLRMLHVDDPDHGELVRKELGKDWDQFVATTDRRQIAAIASGDQRHGLRRVDPTSFLGSQTPALGQGNEAAV